MPATFLGNSYRKTANQDAAKENEIINNNIAAYNKMPISRLNWGRLYSKILRNK